jgi:TIR domain/Pentapeptide repeats (8 copies)
MADKEHIRRLKQGVDAWNTWRSGSSYTTYHQFCPDLNGADLHGANLHGADLSRADLRNADLRNADLTRAMLRRADLMDADLNGANLTLAIGDMARLTRANLSGVDLYRADLSVTDLIAANLSAARLIGADLGGADLSGANLNGANLSGAYLRDANLSRTDLTKVVLRETIFADVNLVSVVGLETCEHQGPSTIDHRTLQKSGLLPLSFLRGVGLPDKLIEYLRSLLNQAFQHYSCFISYSTKDQEFADRLYADLQNKGVRCWFAPHDLPIGGKILDEIDAAIRLRDKVLLILSKHSIKSDWVEDEVTKGFEEERKRAQIVLFPVRLDDVIMATNEAWAAKLRARFIGDFQRWKDHDAYKQSLKRVMRDLTIQPKSP